MTTQQKQTVRKYLYAVTVTHEYPYNYTGSLQGFSVGRNQEEALINYSMEHYPNHEPSAQLFRDLRKQFRFSRVKEVQHHKINLEELLTS